MLGLHPRFLSGESQTQRSGGQVRTWQARSALGGWGGEGGSGEDAHRTLKRRPETHLKGAASDSSNLPSGFAARIRSPGDPKIQKKIEEADESTSQGHFQPTASLTSRAARDIFVRQSPTESDESDESGHPPPPIHPPRMSDESDSVWATGRDTRVEPRDESNTTASARGGHRQELARSRSRSRGDTSSSRSQKGGVYCRTLSERRVDSWLRLYMSTI